MNAGSSADRLVAMANQIARNLTHDVDPPETLADHIDAFWAPQMKAALLAHGDAGLDPIARAALGLLASGRAVAPHTRATDPAAQGSDAG